MNRAIALVLASLVAAALLCLGITTEVPVGGVHGIVRMAENGRPLGKVLVSFTVHGHFEDEQGKTWHVRTAQDGTYNFPSLPAGLYQVNVFAGEHTLGDRFVDVLEGSRTTENLSLKPNEKYLNFTADQYVASPDKPIEAEVTGFFDSPSYKLVAHRLKLDAVVREGGVEQTLGPIARANGASEANYAAISQPAWSEDHRIKKKDAEGAFVETLKIPPMKEGLYYVAASVGALGQGFFLNVTRMALVTKSTAHSALCYVTDIDSGKPIPGAEISVGMGKQIRQAGLADEKGICRLDLDPYKPSSATGNNLVVIAKNAASIALCHFFRGSNQSDEGDDEDASATPPDPNVHIYTYADRPVYRPGDTVQFKSVVRRQVGKSYRLPGPGNAKIRIYDADDDLLATQTLPLSSHGTLHGSYVTNVEAPPGVYRIDVLAAGGKDSYYANLAAYRKPEYSVVVTSSKKRVSIGDKANATIECQYFFGGPVVGAKVNVTILRSPVWAGADPSDDSDSEASGDEYSGGDFVKEFETETDGTGRAQIEFDTDPDAANASDSDPKSSPDQGAFDSTDYRYSVHASVSEPDGKAYEGTGSVLATQGNIRLSAQTDPFIVTRGEKATLLVEATSQDKPYGPSPNRSLEIQLGADTWENGDDKFTVLQTLRAQTGPDGRALVPLSVGRPESLSIRVQTRDDDGNVVRAESYLYVEGSFPRFKSGQANLSVKLDKKKYNAGDTIKALVSTASPGGTALVTVETDEISQVFTLPMTSSSQLIHIPVTKDMSPNAFVGVAYVHNRKFGQATSRVLVQRLDQRLQVTVTPDKTKTLPGTTVAFRIRTADENGRGVPADVSLGVVDESIYAIKPDTTDIAAGLFPQVTPSVETRYSFPEIYLDGGDKAGGSIAVRRKFEDTAAWKPDVQTDASGEASVSVKLPDNLTSWRATAVAATDESAVGMTTVDVQARKPLMVRMECPQFMVATDKQTLTAAITNDTGQATDVNLNLRMTGLQEQSAPPKSIHLDAGETRSIPVDAIAPNSGSVSVVAEVTSNGASDAVETRFEVIPHGRLEESRSSGSIEAHTKIDLNALPTRDRSTGELKLTITPNVAAGLLQSIDSLVRFPYGCVEQTMSRFLPAVLVTHALHDTPFRRVDLEAKTKKIAADGFQRLLKMQHENGGWGWWNYDDSDAMMTGWVLDGLKRAKAAGYPSPSYLDTSKTVAWGVEHLSKPYPYEDITAKLFLALGVAEYGEAKPALAVVRKVNTRRADLGEMALATLVADAAGASKLRDDLLAKVVSRAEHDRFDKREYDGFWSENERLALVLIAVTRLQPENPNIQDWVARLMKERRYNGWADTRESSLATEALTQYLAITHDALQSSIVTVKLNGKEIRKVTIDPADFDSPLLTMTVPIGRLSDGANRLELIAEGGKPFYATELRQFDVQSTFMREMGAANLTIERRYFLMEPAKLPDGTMKLMPSPLGNHQAKQGDVIRCEITLRADHPVSYLMVEDPIPSNCHVTDREDPGDDEQWTDWWSSIVIRDDRVSLFSRWMDKGVHKLTYTMRAEELGTATALPTRAQNMYIPDDWSSSPADTLEVRQ